ncbi:MAG: hypothetical protein WA110_05525 [Anaerolineaceae bacterium]
MNTNITMKRKTKLCRRQQPHTSIIISKKMVSTSIFLLNSPTWIIPMLSMDMISIKEWEHILVMSTPMTLPGMNTLTKLGFR